MNEAIKDEATKAIEMAKALLPTLTADGIGAGAVVNGRYRTVFSGPVFEEDRRQFSVACVATAIAFLRQCRHTKIPNLNSYGLKHAAERWGMCHGMESYVANGDLIAAAIFLGFNIDTSDNLNAAIAVSVEDVQRLDPTCMWSRKYYKGDYYKQHKFLGK